MIRAEATSQGWDWGSARVFCISLSPSVSGEGSSCVRNTGLEEMATDRGVPVANSGCLPRSSKMARGPDRLLAVKTRAVWRTVHSVPACAYSPVIRRDSLTTLRFSSRLFQIARALAGLPSPDFPRGSFYRPQTSPLGALEFRVDPTEVPSPSWMCWAMYVCEWSRHTDRLP